MRNITDLPHVIQPAICYLSGSTLQKLGSERGISKQAAQKQVQKGLGLLKNIEYLYSFPNALDELDESQKENQRLTHLVTRLKQQLVITSAQKQMLLFFKERVLKVFSRFKVKRLSASEKKTVLDWLGKFKRLGGKASVFAASIGFSPQTLTRWQALYEKYGVSALADKTTRPKNFGHKVPLWIKQHLIALFLKFPRWTPYQYHSYLRHNPAISYYVSLPTIQKLKNIHRQRTEREKERIKKRWCFAPGTSAWTVDFTTILKTPYYRLQLLTISDQRSRFLFPTALFLNTSTQAVINHLEELFIKYGKPMIIKVDAGPEFKTDCRTQLNSFGVYLLSNPKYYGQFNGAHERIHRTLKRFISKFYQHQDIIRLVKEIESFTEQYNFSMNFDYLEGKSPSEIFFNQKDFIPKNTEVIKPYEKNSELRMKFTNRKGKPARLSMPLISNTSKA